MGMLINEHIGVIEDLKSTMSVCMPEPEKTEICTSLNEAIDIMRKYQKVKRIIKAVDDRDIGYATMMDALHEVIENGNDD